MSKKNDNVIAKNVHDVHLYLEEQPLIMSEHHYSQIRCSVDVNCESLSQTDDTSSQSSSITKDTDLLLPDPFYQPKKTVHTSNLTPFICREGYKHYDGLTDVNDGIFKELCCYGRSYPIKESRPCNHFEDKNPVYDYEDGILRF